MLGPLRRIVGKLLGSGAAAGASVMLLLFAVELSSAAGMQMMGVHDAAVQHTLIHRYGPGVLRQQLAILAVYLALGALYGGGVAFALRLWEHARGRSRSRFRRWLLAAAGALAIETWRLALAVIHYPQLFNEVLYRRGGARAWLQVALTEHVPRHALEVAGWLALAFLFLGPAATTRGRAFVQRSITRLRRRFSGTPGSRATKGGGGLMRRSIARLLRHARGTPDSTGTAGSDGFVQRSISHFHRRFGGTPGSPATVDGDGLVQRSITRLRRRFGGMPGSATAGGDGFVQRSVARARRRFGGMPGSATTGAGGFVQRSIARLRQLFSRMPGSAKAGGDGFVQRSIARLRRRLGGTAGSTATAGGDGFVQRSIARLGRRFDGMPGSEAAGGDGFLQRSMPRLRGRSGGTRGSTATAGGGIVQRSIGRVGLAILFAGFGVIAVAALRETRPAAVAADVPPNVLILAVDSLRADRVGPGHEVVAPRLAALAARAVRFEAAEVTVPRTFPSWVTLLSGRWPHHHGIRHMFPDAAERSATGPLLPSLMAAHGMHTAVVSDYSGEIFSRLDAGFEERDVPSFNAETIAHQAGLNLHPALVPYSATLVGNAVASSLQSAPDNADPDRLADRAIATIRAAGKRGPFFITTFFSAPHFPYAAPDPYYRRFTDPDYRGPFRYEKPVAVLGNSDADLTPRDIAQVRALYDGAVAAVDDAIGRILDELEASGLADRTIVVLLADHGEGLYEPGRGMGHGEHLQGDQVTHIPLLLFDPVHRFPPHAVPGVVRDVDLAPTLAALTGTPLAGADGVDLRPLLTGERATLDLTAYSETGLWFVDNGPGFRPGERLPYPSLPAMVTVAPDDDIILAPLLKRLVVVAKHRALRDDHWKLRYAPTRGGVTWSLYDLAADPDERTDVASQHPERFAALKAKLLAWMAQDGSLVENDFVVPR